MTAAALANAIDLQPRSPACGAASCAPAGAAPRAFHAVVRGCALKKRDVVDKAKGKTATGAAAWALLGAVPARVRVRVATARLPRPAALRTGGVAARKRALASEGGDDANSNSASAGDGEERPEDEPAAVAAAHAGWAAAWAQRRERERTRKQAKQQKGPAAAAAPVAAPANTDAAETNEVAETEAAAGDESKSAEAAA